MDKNSNRPGYKMTKAGWIPEDWIISTLGKSEHFLTSGSRGWSQYYCDRGELFVRITNLSRESINLDYADCRFVKLPSNGSEGTRTTLNAGDILVSITADLGIIGYFSSEEPYPRAYVNQHVALLRILDTKIYSKFVAYQLAAPRAQKRFRQITDQGAKAGLNLSSIRSFPVAFPSLAEQEGIADVLECWDRAIRGYEKKIEKKREIKKGLMQQLLTGKRRLPGCGKDYHEGHEENEELRNGLSHKKQKEKQFYHEAHEELEEGRIPEGWKEVRLGEICDVIMGQSPESVGYNKKKEGIPLIQGNADIRNGISSPRFWTKHITKQCRIGDILMSVRAPIGEIARAVHDACIGRGMCAMRGLSIDQEYLYYSLLVSESIWMAYGQGSTFSAINSRDINRFPLLIPQKVLEQRAIAGVLAAADGEIGALERKLGALREQKRFLLNNLVTGTIRLPEFRRELP